MRKDKFFKFSFFTTVFLMVMVFASNIHIERPSSSSFPKKRGGWIIFEKVDVDKIKKLIAEGKLSDKESLFYKVIGDTKFIPENQH